MTRTTHNEQTQHDPRGRAWRQTAHGFFWTAAAIVLALGAANVLS